MSGNPYSVGSLPVDGMNQNPYKAPQYHPMEPLHAVAPWLAFLGWVCIIAGVIYCLTIIGLIIGWLPIWMGILLKGASERLKLGFQSGNEAELYAASKNLGTYFIILGILTLIAMIINLLYIGVVVMAVVGVLAGAAGGM
ncbi:MAG: DUF5362 domain-containing protein [Planctomycetaceae bacterium]|nr:DUF5362 domain-containing protein [Planctomycetaceae bacterium]